MRRSSLDDLRMQVRSVYDVAVICVDASVVPTYFATICLLNTYKCSVDVLSSSCELSQSALQRSCVQIVMRVLPDAPSGYH